MAAPTVSTPAAPVMPRWGLMDPLVGWVVSFFAAGVFAIVVIAAAGYDSTDDIPLGIQAVLQLPLWAGLVTTAIWAAAVKGNGWRYDFRAAITLGDIPVGIVAGLVGQFILVPLVSLPVLMLSGKTTEDLSAPAKELADKAVGGWSVFLLFVIVGIGAPLAEELFFRGLVLRAFEKRFAPIWALVGSSLCFGFVHLQPLQFFGLAAAGAVFGALAQRYNRLGPAVIAHLTFNVSSVMVLLWAT